MSTDHQTSALVPFDPADPYPHYRSMREHAPVLVDERGASFYLYEDCEALIGDRRVGVRPPPDPHVPLHERPPEVNERTSRLAQLFFAMMSFKDPPAHTRLRSALASMFTGRVVSQLETTVRSIAAQLVATLPRQGTFDVVKEFCFPFPAMVMAHCLELPMGDIEKFKEWSAAIVAFICSMPDSLEPAEIALTSLCGYFREIRLRAISTGRTDVIGEFARSDKYSEDEFLANLIFLLVAGHETTTSFLASSFLAIATDPQMQERLRSDSALYPTAVDEFLRIDSPTQVLTRFFHHETEIRGRTFKRGVPITVYLGSANRDPLRFENPDTIQLDRPNNRHLAFGGGGHYCLGALLAKAEGRIALELVLQRCRSLTLAEPAKRLPLHVFRQLTHVVLTSS